MIEDKREGLVGASGFQPLTSWIPTRQSDLKGSEPSIVRQRCLKPLHVGSRALP